MIFVDDSQGFESLSYLKNQFKYWAETSKDNPVFFQIGYEVDENLWVKSPISFTKTILDETT